MPEAYLHDLIFNYRIYRCIRCRDFLRLPPDYCWIIFWDGISVAGQVCKSHICQVICCITCIQQGERHSVSGPWVGLGAALICQSDPMCFNKPEWSQWLLALPCYWYLPHAQLPQLPQLSQLSQHSPTLSLSLSVSLCLSLSLSLFLSVSLSLSLSPSFFSIVHSTMQQISIHFSYSQQFSELLFGATITSSEHIKSASSILFCPRPCLTTS